MYSCAVILFLATPLALGSFLALAFAVPLCLMLAVRLLHEERFLSRELPGYDDYRRKVRRRLVPGVW
jgi:protein-S-isoprenylcysteine O-methyltransferase Ste14